MQNINRTLSQEDYYLRRNYSY